MKINKHEKKKVSNILGMILFADDTNIFYSHKAPNFLNTVVNTELELDKLSSWGRLFEA